MQGRIAKIADSLRALEESQRRLELERERLERCACRATGAVDVPGPGGRRRNRRGRDNMKNLNNIYTYHAPKGDQQERYEDIREKARELAELIERCCPDSREKSLAHTKLEEAVMWANASIARNE